MKKISLPLAISLMIVSAIIGLAGGYYLAPEYQTTMYSSAEMGLGQADRYVDLRYIQQMGTHHLGAIRLAEQAAAQSQRPELQSLATDIQVGEPKLIAELSGWKKDWYSDSRNFSEPVVAKLSSADEKFDLRFLNALIAHHQAGIEMTQEIRSKSSRKEILDNADAVENFLTNSLVTLKGWRAEWFNVN